MRKKIVIFAFLGLSILLYAKSNKIISWVKDSGIDNINVKKEYEENTNFDNFYDKKGNAKYESISEKDILLLNIDSMGDRKIYAKHTLNLSSAFTTVIFSYESEMELNTILVNYDLKGEKVASLEVAYDEIAESAFRTESIISKNSIITVNANYFDDPPSYTTNTYKIESNGKIVENK